MTLTLPTVFGPQYSGTNTDFNLAKMDRSGAVRCQEFTVSIPGATAQGTLIGIVPFNKGFRFHPAASIVSVADLDTGTTVTLNFGFTYYDSTLGTSAGAAWASAVTTAQAGGQIPFIQTTETNVVVWKAAADGWLTLTIQAGPTTTTGDVYGQIFGSYDTDPGI